MGRNQVMQGRESRESRVMQGREGRKNASSYREGEKGREGGVLKAVWLVLANWVSCQRVMGGGHATRLRSRDT